MRASVTYDLDSVLRGDSFRGYVHDLQLAVEAERGYVDQAETCQLIYDQLAPDLRLGMISRPLKSVGIEEFVQECVRWQDDWVTIANRKRNKAKKKAQGTAKALAPPSGPPIGPQNLIPTRKILQHLQSEKL